MMYTYSESSIFSPSTQIFSHFSHLFHRLSELFFAYILPITSPIAMMYTYSESSIYSPPAQLFSEFSQPKHMCRYLQVLAGTCRYLQVCKNPQVPVYPQVQVPVHRYLWTQIPVRVQVWIFWSQVPVSRLQVPVRMYS